MNPEQRAFILKAAKAANDAQHIFPTMAATEAAEESAYGTSLLAIQGNNLFGCKAHRHSTYGVLNLPTREFINTEWITESAAFVDYPDWAACFADRMATLRRLAPTFPYYKQALAATDPQTYVWAVSKSWSTDPKRAATIANVYRIFMELDSNAYPTNT